MSSATSADPNPPRFVSLRWRLFLPTFAIVLILAMASVYVVARSLPSGAESSRVSVLLNNGRLISDRAAAVAESQRLEVDRLAQMPEVGAALASGDAEAMRALLENFARRADLDAAVLTDAAGTAALGVLRAEQGGVYEPVPPQAVTEQTIVASSIVTANGEPLGTAYVGTRAARWADEVRGSAAAEVALYRDARLLATSVDTPSALPAEVPAQFLQSGSGEPFQAIELGESTFLGVYTPLPNGDVIAVFVPDNAPFAAEAGQQLIALTLTTVAAGIIITVFVMTNYFLERVNRVRQVAEALAAGESSVRTGMLPTDEIGALGYALDLYTGRVQERHDKLRASLRRQRREVEYFNAVLESLADGMIIQDVDGNVTFINERAKRLIGESYNFFKRAELREITAAVTDVLGSALAPGLYTLGVPTRVELNGRVLSLQAFAVMSMADRRVGTVTLIRDVTEIAQRERLRIALLDRLTDEVEQPLAEEAGLSHQIRRHAGALQKLIVEMRDVVSADTPLVQNTSRIMPLETLVWAVANEWRQVAQAANLLLNVEVEHPGLQVYGDERRLRWALGNIVDNAIKYTPPGGRVYIEIKGEEDGYARLRIRDNGVGISAEELPHVFTRFYRGNPVGGSGRELRVPGTGQGLTIARQIIEAGGGRIYLRSSPGVGTAVYFTLPLDPLPERPRSHLFAAADVEEDETVTLEDTRDL